MNSTKHSQSTHKIREHVITAAGLRMYYHTAGDPKNPPLLFLHGWGIRWNRFGPWCGIKGVIEELQHHFYVIAPELPGLVRSEAPKTYRGYEEYAYIIHALVKAIGINEPVYVMGSSFGGTIATLYAKDFPKDVRRLILINAILTFQAGGSYPKMLEVWSILYPKLLASSYVPKIIKKIVVNLFFGTPFRHITDEDVERKQSLGDPLMYVYDMDYELIHVPVLLVWGKSDTKVPLEKAQDMVRKIRDGKLVTVPGGHSTTYPPEPEPTPHFDVTTEEGRKAFEAYHNKRLSEGFQRSLARQRGR
jgi:pimeloyl-ACP methyl ester carboxylesterase